MKRIALVVLIGAVPLIAYGQKAGTSILEGGGSGSFPVPTFATTVTNTFVLWGWGGRFLADGMEIGPYVSLSYTGTQDRSDRTSSSTFTVNPGVQAGIVFDNDDVTLMLRVTTAVQLRGDISTSPGVTSSNFSVPGLWVEIDPEVAMDLGERAAFTIGPVFSAYYSLVPGLLSFIVGFNIGFRFLF